MRTNIQLTYLRVFDMTIGRGVMPSSVDPVIAEFNDNLVPHLTPSEEEVVRDAFRRCYARAYPGIIKS